MNLIEQIKVNDVSIDGYQGTYYDENPEWVRVILDSEDKVLAGIKADGTVEWSIGVPTPIKDFVEQLVLQQLALKVDKEENKSLIDSSIAESMSCIDSPEYIQVTTDRKDKILMGIKENGAIYIPILENDSIEQKVDDALEKIDASVNEVLSEISERVGPIASYFSEIDDSENRLYLGLDNETKIVHFRDTQGMLHENVGIETPKVNTKEIYLSDIGKAKLLEEINPYLRIDRIDIISTKLIVSGDYISPLNNSKNEVGDVDTDDVVFKYTSKNGGFVDNCVIAYQGNSSLRWTKKGFGVDTQNKHRFKDWIEHDSFNIKGYATDWMHVREYIGTSIYEQMMRHRPIGHRRPWELYNDFKDSDYQNGCPSSALGHSDLHPVELYINGNYWGLYSISLKKKKENYEMKKNNAKHIMLDADGFSCAGNWFSWAGAEIRFPKEDKSKKKLLDKDLNKYDGDNPTELLGADNPLYDANNPTHVFCNTVKQKILAFYQFNHDINNSTTKEQIEAHWNVEEFIDNYLHTNFIGNSDVGGKNTLYCTWDGVHWAPLAYDFDLTFGCGWTNGINQVDVHLAFERYPASNMEGAWDCIPGASQIKALYQTEIETRYKELRDTGIFTAENVAKIIKDWMIEVGEDVYKDDIDRWSSVYGNRGTKNMYGEEDVECYVNQKALYDYVVTRLTELDTLFNYTSN